VGTAVHIGAAVLLLGVGTTPAVGQQGISFEGRAGIAVPAGDLGDTHDAGFAAGLGLGFDLGSRAALAADVELGAFGKGVASDGGGGPGPAADLRLWHLTAGIELELLDPTMTYWTLTVDGGGGITAFDPDPGEGHTYGAGRAGLSLGYRFSSEAALVAGVRAYALFVDEADFEESASFDVRGGTLWTVPITAGLRLSF
ncbi:MAG: hypothetical protein ACOC83_07395, partial [Gemmatimonadota bacterium]